MAYITPKLLKNGNYSFKLKSPGKSFIVHVTAGVEGIWEPTTKEIDEICVKFMDALEDGRKSVVTRKGVRARVIKLKKNQTLHIEAGSDSWDPTPTELSTIEALFNEAMKDSSGAIVATRFGVKAKTLT